MSLYWSQTVHHMSSFSLIMVMGDYVLPVYLHYSPSFLLHFPAIGRILAVSVVITGG